MFPVWFFQGMERMKYLTIINIISKTVFTLSIFIVIQDTSDYYFVPILNGAGWLIGSIISLWIIHNKFNQKFKFYDVIIVKKYFIDSSKFFLSRIANEGNHYYLTVIIGLMYGNTITGYYTMIERLYKAFYFGVQPLILVIYPYISKNKNLSFFKKIYYPTSLLFGLLAIILILFSEQLLFIIYGLSNILMNNLFDILFTVTLLGISNALIGYPLLAAMGFPDKANLGLIYGALVSFIYTTIGFYFDFTITKLIFTLFIYEICSLSYRAYFVKRLIIHKG